MLYFVRCILLSGLSKFSAMRQSLLYEDPKRTLVIVKNRGGDVIRTGGINFKTATTSHLKAHKRGTSSYFDSYIVTFWARTSAYDTPNVRKIGVFEKKIPLAEVPRRWMGAKKPGRGVSSRQCPCPESMGQLNSEVPTSPGRPPNTVPAPKR